METQQPDRALDKIVVVYNPVKVDVKQLQVHVSAQAPASTHIEWVETTPEDAGYSQACDAVRKGADMVVAAGGDGTVRLVASALAETGVVLGILPAGTGNLLARNLNLSLEPEAAARRLVSGADSIIDMCEAELTRMDGSTETMRFAVMAGVGADAQMIENTDEDLKGRIGQVAYLPAVLRALGGGNSVEATFTFDNQRVEKKRLHTLIIGNCGDVYSNVPLLPHARPDDGRLDLVVIAPRSAFGWLRISASIAMNTLVRLWNRDPRNARNQMNVPRPPNALTYEKGKRVSVTFAAPEIFEVDGDPVGRVSAATVNIMPAALVVRA